MGEKRPRTIDVVSREVYDTLQQAANEHNQSLRFFVNKILENNMEGERILKKYFPNLEIISHNKDAIFVNDKDLNKVFTINVVDGGLSCNTCDSSEMCKHIAFTLSKPHILNELEENSKL